jgi:hypothetical protein
VAQLRFANADLTLALEAAQRARLESAPSSPSARNGHAHAGSAHKEHPHVHARHADSEGAWMWPGLSSHGYLSSTAIRRLAGIGTRTGEPAPEVATSSLFGDRIPWT